MTHTGTIAADEATRAAAKVASPPHVYGIAPMLFANLPDPTKLPAGVRTAVTDSGLTFAAANFGSTVTGGGANFVPVINNGAAWKIG